MNYVIDLVCVAIIVLLAVSGYKKGLVKGMFGIISLLLSWVVTAIIYKPVSEYIISLPFVQDKITLAGEKIALAITKGNTQSMPDWLSETAVSAAQEASVSISYSINSILVSIFCIVVIYILVKLALRLFEGVFETVVKLPGLNLLNKAGGLVCGIIKSVAVLWIILACVVLFAGTEFFDAVNDAVQQSMIAKEFYNNNILIKIIIR